MGDPALAGFVERMMREDIAPTLQPSPHRPAGLCGEVLARFRNPAIEHQLSQIAWDGSQKLPYRLLDTLRRRARRRAAARAARHRRSRPGCCSCDARRAPACEIVDPLAAALDAGRGGCDAVPRLLALRQIFPACLAEDSTVRAAIVDAADRIEGSGVRACLAAGMRRKPLPDLDDIMTAAPVIPVLVMDRVEDAVPVAEALVAGGLPVLEVTLRTPAALDVDPRDASRCPGAIVGAGTVLNPDTLDQAIEAGRRIRGQPRPDRPAGRAPPAEAPIPLLPGVAIGERHHARAGPWLHSAQILPGDGGGRRAGAEGPERRCSAA